jgi:hypothetical protein
MKGYYSLIQFCPDLSRLEAINIGVLIYCPEAGRLEFLLTHSNERIRVVFGEQDWDFVNRARESVESHLRLGFDTVTTLESYISSRANVIQLTPLRSLIMGEIILEIAYLYRRLVDVEAL